MKAKLITGCRNISSIYASYLQWAFVKKVGEDYELIHEFFSCKDYTHEMIANAVHNARITTNHGVPIFELDKDKIQLALLLKGKNSNPDTFKEILYSAKNFFSDLEVQAKLPKTLIKEVSCDASYSRVFILTMKRHHIESPVLLHSLLALLRTIILNTKVVTKENILEVLESNRSKDWNILVYLIKHNLLETLLNKHKEFFHNVDLREIYPTQDKIQFGTDYHSGFGPVALQSKCLCSKLYSEKLYPLIDSIKKEK